MDDRLASILAAFGPSIPPRGIPKSLVQTWMHDADIEVQGAVYQAIAESPQADRVVPPLTFDDYFEFVIPFLVKCIKDNPQGELTRGRYIAGHEFKNWFVGFWNDADVPREKLAEMKAVLSSLYSQGDTAVRDVVINSILEHLFEHAEIRTYFADWAADPELADAHRDATQWADTVDRAPLP